MSLRTWACFVIFSCSRLSLLLHFSFFFPARVRKRAKGDPFALLLLRGRLRFRSNVVVVAAVVIIVVAAAVVVVVVVDTLISFFFPNRSNFY